MASTYALNARAATATRKPVRVLRKFWNRVSRLLNILVCLSYKPIKYVMSIFVKDRGILFLHIPKTAGSSISNWLVARGGVYSDGYSHTALHQSYHDISKLWTFCVVRNPWDRMVSTYFYVKKINPAFTDISFHDWLRTGLDFRRERTGMGYRRDWYSVKTPQLDWIQIRPSKIMRFESLAQDFVEVQERFNDYEPLPFVNTTEHEPYQNYYDDWSRQLVQNLFHTDITEFGYTF